MLIKLWFFYDKFHLIGVDDHSKVADISMMNFAFMLIADINVYFSCVMSEFYISENVGIKNKCGNILCMYIFWKCLQ